MTKLKWGMIGGGEDSQIGLAHRIAAQMDGAFEFVAGALDIEPDRGLAFALRLGATTDRAYPDWQSMLEGERNRADRIDLVTIATPNTTHCEIAGAFLAAGFHVLCEKPLATTTADAVSIVRLAREHDRICAVNYGYSGYPMVRQMRAMIADGDLGKLRVIVAEFAHGHHADAAMSDHPRLRWRYDPGLAGNSAVLADAGIHALHLACFVTGQQVQRVSADFASCVEGRELEDDALVAFRMSKGAVGRLWSSAVAIGRSHGLTLQVFGERGGLRWGQEHPDQLYWTPLGEPTRTLQRGHAGLSDDAVKASRTTEGHAEGMLPAFANIYGDLAELILAHNTGRGATATVTSCPMAADGLHSVQVIDCAARSARSAGRWIDVREP